MNVFVIPSWYPSLSHRLVGIFFKEQAEAFADQYEDINIGISLWGQNDERLLLWSRSPIRSLVKLLSKPDPSFLLRTNNLAEFFRPAFTWSSKIASGNLHAIERINRSNLNDFQSRFGKVNLIHAHVGFPAGYIAMKLSLAFDIPYIITEHMSPFPHKQFLKGNRHLDQRLRMAYQKAAQNICVSQSLKQQMNSFGISNNTVIPNMIDEDFFKPAQRKPENSYFTFFSLGRLVPQKGIDILLSAFAEVKSNATLRIGGDGPYLNEYKKLSDKLGISSKLKWLGELDRSQAVGEYQKCDVFVLSSRHESMGVVFAEAMACGKPVIAPICGGPEEFISDDCGYLVAPENIDDLKKALQNMIDNHRTFSTRTIRNHSLSLFSKDVICSQLRDIYYETIEKFK